MAASLDLELMELERLADGESHVRLERRLRDADVV